MILLIFTLLIFILFLAILSLKELRGKKNAYSNKKEKTNTEPEDDSTVQKMFNLLNQNDKNESN